MTNTKTLTIGFNPLRGTIAQQLTELNFKFEKEEAMEFEESRNAIFQLSISSLITDTEEAKIKLRLFKDIERHVKKVGQLKKAINR